MARIPQPDPVEYVQVDPTHRVPRQYMTPEERALFPEPDHVPELETQDAYEAARSDPWLGSDDEPVTAQRLSFEVHRGPRAGCTWPSHQPWAVERFGRSRDDQHTG